MIIERQPCGCRISNGQYVERCPLHYGQALTTRQDNVSFHHLEFDISEKALEALDRITERGISLWRDDDMSPHGEDDSTLAELTNFWNLLYAMGTCIRDDRKRAIEARTTQPRSNEDLL